jgi:hypothetical protein
MRRHCLAYSTRFLRLAVSTVSYPQSLHQFVYQRTPTQRVALANPHDRTLFQIHTSDVRAPLALGFS